MLSRSCFSLTMASRFEIVDENYIEKLKDKNENENTNNSTEYWKNVFKKWANKRNFQAIFKSARERCLRLNTVPVLCIQKFNNFALFITSSFYQN